MFMLYLFFLLLLSGIDINAQSVTVDFSKVEVGQPQKSGANR